MSPIPSLGASQTYPRPQKNVVGKLGLGSLGWGKTMSEQKLFVPIKLSGLALYDDGQMINSHVIDHVNKERLGCCRWRAEMCRFCYQVCFRIHRQHIHFERLTEKCDQGICRWKICLCRPSYGIR